MTIRRILLACTLGVLVPLSAHTAESGPSPQFEVERDWSGELRPRYRGPQVEGPAPPSLPAPVPQAAPKAAPKIEVSPPAKPRVQARVTEVPGRETRPDAESFAWDDPDWETDDRRQGPDRAWSQRERREREYAARAYAEQMWREEVQAERDRRERIRWRREQRASDFYDEEQYWDDCDSGWDRC